MIIDSSFSTSSSSFGAMQATEARARSGMSEAIERALLGMWAPTSTNLRAVTVPRPQLDVASY